jgi:NTE family protein
VVRLELNELGGELRTDLALGSIYNISAEFYQPLEYSRTLFVAPALFFDSQAEDVYSDSQSLGSYRTDSWGGHFDLGLNLGRLAEFRTGYWLGQTETEPRSGALDFPKTSDDLGALKFGLGFDMIDHLAIPHHGVAGSIQAWLSRPDLGASLDFSRYWGHLVGATTLQDWTFQFRTQGGGSEGDLPAYRQFLMGGLRDITGVADRSLRGGAFGMAGVGILNHVSGLNLPYALQMYVGGWFDVGNTWEKPEYARLDDLLAGGALTVLLETAFGPLEFGYGRSSSGRGSLYLQAGIHFAQPLNR